MAIKTPNTTDTPIPLDTLLKHTAIRMVIEGTLKFTK